MKIEKDKLELAARIFLSEQPKFLATGKILTDELSEVRLYKEYTSNKNKNAALNMYLNESGKGWVVLSTDNDLPAIWAESNEEITDVRDCPPFDTMMEIYLGDIEVMLEKIESSLEKNDGESVDFMRSITTNQQQWTKLLDGELTQNTLCSGANSESNGKSFCVDSSWAQRGEYNGSVNRYCQDLCPTSGQYLVGCVPVAVAQVLRQRSQANGHRGILLKGMVDYKWNNKEIHEDLNHLWSSFNMQPVIWSTTPKERRDEVMNFLKYVAFMVKADFGTKATGASFNDVVHAIRNNINGGACSDIFHNDHGSFWAKIIDEVGKGCPALVTGGNNKNKYHMFIIDGHYRAWFDTYSFYHFNMGWGLGANFWGRGSDYNKNMKAVIGINLVS